MRNSTVLFLALSLSTLGACAAPIGEGSDVSTSADSLGATSSVRPVFSVWRATDGWRWQLVAASGEALLDSQAYSTRTAALGGLLSVLDRGDDETAYRVANDATNALTLRAGNGATIGDGGRFASRAEADAALAATVDAVIDYQVWRASRSGRRFDVFVGADRRWYYRLRAGNGRTVLASEGYSTEAGALNGTFAVAAEGATAARYVVRQAADGKWYFNLTASNGQVIGTSETYVTTRRSAERGRDAVIALVPTVDLL